MFRIAKFVRTARIVATPSNRKALILSQSRFTPRAVFFSTKEDAAPPVTDAEKETEAEQPAAADTTTPPAVEDVNVKLIADLQKEIKDLKDKVVRSYAEEENVRRIARRDVNNAKDYATQSFAKSMLEVSDDLERALSVAPKEKTDNNELNLLVEGMQMTERNLQKIFLKFGISKFGEVDDVFDPSIHDALFQMPAVTTISL